MDVVGQDSGALAMAREGQRTNASTRADGQPAGPGGILAAETSDELTEVLSRTLAALFPDLRRYRLMPASDPVAGEPVAMRGQVMSAPVTSGRRPVGWIEAEATPGRRFTNLDQQILDGVAGVVSLALQRLHSRRAAQVQAYRELDRGSAAEVQRRFLARSLPADAGVKVDAQYLPALEVGGDFYGLSCLGDGRIGAAIGDVSGKGVSAALIMSRVSSDILRAVRRDLGPSRVLEKVGDALSELGSDRFVTAACLTLDPSRKSLVVANAGHMPLVVLRVDGEVFEFGQPSGPPLGILRCEYFEEHLDLQAGDIVLLMTDGLVDALDFPAGGSFTTFLQGIVESVPHEPKAVNERILEAASEGWDSHPGDDVTLVALQFEGG